MKKLFTALLFLLPSLLIGQVPQTVFHQSVAWSPNGKLIYFAATIITDKKYQKGKWDIYAMNNDGTGLQKITDNAVDDYFPSLSPDGKQMVFNTNRDGVSQIYRMDVDGKNVVRLTNNSFNDYHPAWSPDGRTILFSSTRDKNDELYSMNSDGTDQKRLTHTEFREHNAAWSPDGKKVVYYYEKGDKKDQVYVMNADGSHAVNITSDTLNNIYPSWYFNDKVVYSSNSGGMVRAAIDGSVKEKLGVDSFYGRFSPDGKKLCYIKGHFPDSEIHIMDVVTKEVIIINNNEILK